jgi:hypothetical protein
MGSLTCPVLLLSRLGERDYIDGLGAAERTPEPCEVAL